MERKNAWEGYNADQLEELDGLASRYIDYISNNKTERRCFAAAVKQAEAAGYESLENVVREGRTLEAGSKVWAGVHGKSLILAHIGTEPLEAGLNILGAHIDSPRLDLKQNPVYENNGFAFLDTHYYGGIKHYQWVTLPLALRRILAASRMLSSDVSAGFDPAYASVFETKNAAYLGKGLVFNKYTGARGKSGSNDARAEYVAYVRRVMDDAEVSFQTAELGKVDAGGGGTIAYIPAKYGMDVIDSGVAVLSMHAPWEVTSKADIFEAYRGYRAFLEA